MQEKWDLRWIRIAREVSTWSKDPSKGVGAVAVKDNRMISQGYNGFPRGIPDRESWLMNRDKKLELTIHAEENVIYNAAYNGQCLQGATVYVYGLPVCDQCAKRLIQSGVRRVVALDMYDDPTWKESTNKSIKLFTMAKVEYIILPSSVKRNL